MPLLIKTVLQRSQSATAVAVISWRNAEFSNAMCSGAIWYRYDSYKNWFSVSLDLECRQKRRAFHATASIIHATLALGDRVRPLELVSTAVGLRLGKKEQRRWNMFCLQESWNMLAGNYCKQFSSFLCHGNRGDSLTTDNSKQYQTTCCRTIVTTLESRRTSHCCAHMQILANHRMYISVQKSMFWIFHTWNC